MKHALALAALALAAAGCAASASKPEAAPQAAQASAPSGQCTPAPAELVVKDLEVGTGDTVRFRTALLVSYTGWVYDPCKPDHKGAEFDTTQGHPDMSFMAGVGRVIRGWDEGVIGMKEGGKRILVIPADKAYGAHGVPGKIPPNSPLVFEIQVDHIIMQPPAR